MKNRKGLTICAAALLLVVLLAGTVAAATGTVTKELYYNDIKVALDGASLDLKDAQGNSVEPFMVDGTNYLPVRAVAEVLGLNVGWDSTTSTVVLTTAAESKSVYITRTGLKYHYDSPAMAEHIGPFQWAPPPEWVSSLATNAYMIKQPPRQVTGAAICEAIK